jgi:hypothetical protein
MAAETDDRTQLLKLVSETLMKSMMVRPLRHALVQSETGPLVIYYKGKLCRLDLVPTADYIESKTFHFLLDIANTIHKLKESELRIYCDAFIAGAALASIQSHIAQSRTPTNQTKLYPEEWKLVFNYIRKRTRQKQNGKPIAAKVACEEVRKQLRTGTFPDINRRVEYKLNTLEQKWSARGK